MSPGIWLARHAQNLLGALGAVSRNPLGTFLTVSVIGIALARFKYGTGDIFNLIGESARRLITVNADADNHIFRF